MWRPIGGGGRRDGSGSGSGKDGGSDEAIKTVAAVTAMIEAAAAMTVNAAAVT
jgi:hypothetical protein